MKEACPYSNTDRCDCYAENGESSVEVGPLEVLPVVVLQGPSMISACQNLSVNGYLSTGSAGRRFVDIEWTTNNTVLNGLIENNDLALTVDSTKLERVIVDGDLWIEITLSLTNFFNKKSSESLVVKIVDDDALPVVEILGGTRSRDVFRPDILSFRSSTAMTCDGTVDLKYVWTLVELSSGYVLNVEASSDPREFVLPPNSLAVDEKYELRLEVSSFGGTATAKLFLTCVPSALVAAIAGGHRSLTSLGGDDVELSAAGSFDPDNATTELTFKWDCTLEEDVGCPDDALEKTEAAALTVKKNRLQEGLIYKFQVTVLSSARNASTSVDITFVGESNSPVVVLTEAPSTVVANERFLLRGAALMAETNAMPESLKAKWSLASGSLADDAALVDYARIDLSSEVEPYGEVSGGGGANCETFMDSPCLLLQSYAFVLAPASLIAGQTYTFRLEVSYDESDDLGYAVGFAEVQVYVPRPPSGGSFRISPRRGRALTTPFELVSQEWDAEDLPLFYRYEIPSSGQVLRLSTLEARASHILLPGGGNETATTLRALITSAVGAEAYADARVEVAAATPDDVASALNDARHFHFYDRACNVLAVAARADVDINVGGLVNLFVEARSRTGDKSAVARTARDQTALFAASLAEIARAGALSLVDAQTALTEIGDVLLDASEFYAESKAAKNALAVVSELLASALFVPSRHLLESAMNDSNDTATRAAEQVSFAIDEMARALAEPLVEDEFQANVTTANVRIAARRTSGSSLTLAASNVSQVTVPEFSGGSGEYVAVATELKVNTHRLEEEGDIRSDVILRFGLWSALGANARKDQSLEVSLRIPRTSPVEERPTAAPTALWDRDDLGTLTCPWGFEGFVETTCDDGSLERRECNGDKEVHAVCDDLTEELCVRWAHANGWSHETCRFNSMASTATTAVCECTVAVGSKLDYATRLHPFSPVLTFTGDVNVVKSHIVLILLGIFAFVVGLLAAVAYFVDKGEAKKAMKASKKEEEAFSVSQSMMQSFSAANLQRLFVTQRILAVEKTTTTEQKDWFPDFLAALYRKHSFAEIWTVYRNDEPRSLRVFKLAAQILLVCAAVAFAQEMEFDADAKCRRFDTKDDCLHRQTIAGRDTCVWSEDAGVCRDQAPPRHYASSASHYYVIIFVIVLVIPIVKVFDWAFDVLCELHYRSAALTREEEERHDDVDVGNVGAVDAQDLPRGLLQDKSKRSVRWKKSVASKEHLAEAREKAAEVEREVSKRFAEIRGDMRDATKRSRDEMETERDREIAARQCQVLRHIEADLVKRWGAPEAESFGESVFLVVSRELSLARAWSADLMRLGLEYGQTNDETTKKCLAKMAEVFSKLSTSDLKVYERRLELHSGHLSAIKKETARSSRFYERVVAWIVVAAVVVLPIYYMLHYATYIDSKARATHRESISWLIEATWSLFLLFAFLEPTQIYLVYVALPSLVVKKLNSPRDSARYPFETKVNEDALDFLVDLDSANLRKLLPKSDDANRLKQVQKKDLTLRDLADIEKVRSSSPFFLRRDLAGPPDAPFLRLPLPGLLRAAPAPPFPGRALRRDVPKYPLGDRLTLLRHPSGLPLRPFRLCDPRPRLRGSPYRWPPLAPRLKAQKKPTEKKGRGKKRLAGPTPPPCPPLATRRKGSRRTFVATTRRRR